MKFYQTLQCVVGCDADLHIPQSRGGVMPDLVVRRRRALDRWPEAVGYYKVIPDGDTVWGRFGRTPRGRHVIEYPGYVTFLVCPEFREIVYDASPACSAATLDHFVLDQAIPLVLSGRGLSILHCSAIHLQLGVVAFLAPSGYGKSTLAASFAAQGFPLACDDCLLVRETPAGFLAVPAYPGVRLWPRSLSALFPGNAGAGSVAQFTAKRRVSQSESLPFSPGAAPLRGLYVLSPSPDEQAESVALEPFVGAAAVGKLLESTFLLTDKLAGPMKAIFSTLAGLAGAGLVHRLSYPTGFHRLSAVRNRVLEHAASLEARRPASLELCL